MNTIKKSILFILLFVGFVKIDAQTITVSGNVSNADSKPITNVVLELISGATTLTATVDAGGNYTFENVPTNVEEISLTASKVDNVLNGVSTFDLVKGLKHILAEEVFDRVDNYIAMDINKSGSVTVLDLAIMRQIILGLINEFPNNAAWRFMEKNQLAAITITGQDYTVNFTNFFNIKDAASVFTVDFVGIKIADANFSAVP